MNTEVCRWGFMSTASISKKNWKAIRHASNATLVGVASRDKTKAQRYIDELQTFTPYDPLPTAIEGYADLLRNDQIDAVYIPLPTGIRKEWVIRAAQAGKHVLCEKPCAITREDLVDILDACRQNNVQFMDGVMFMHSLRLRQMRGAIDEPGNIGDIQRISSAFSFNGGDDWANENIRTSGDLEPLGCLGDLGWYNIRLSLWAKNWKMPQKVRGTMLSEYARPNESSVPIEFAGEMYYDDGCSVSFYCSFNADLQQWGVVSGSSGYLHVDDFVLPYFGSQTHFEVKKADFDVVGCDFNMQDRSVAVRTDEHGNGHSSAQETRMIECFSQNVIEKHVDDHWSQVALKTQTIANACLDSARKDGQFVTIDNS